MIYALLDRLTERYSENEHRLEAMRAREEYFDRAGKVFDDDAELFEGRMAAFLEWYVLERPAAGLGGAGAHRRPPPRAQNGRSSSSASSASGKSSSDSSLRGAPPAAAAPTFEGVNDSELSPRPDSRMSSRPLISVV